MAVLISLPLSFGQQWCSPDIDILIQSVFETLQAESHGSLMAFQMSRFCFFSKSTSFNNVQRCRFKRQPTGLSLSMFTLNCHPNFTLIHPYPTCRHVYIKSPSEFHPYSPLSHLQICLHWITIRISPLFALICPYRYVYIELPSESGLVKIPLQFLSSHGCPHFSSS